MLSKIISSIVQGSSTKSLPTILETFHAVKRDLTQFVDAKQDENFQLAGEIETRELHIEANNYEIDHALKSLAAVNKLVGE